ncbi:MAG TPA: RdgB/HAM1 family non-canonical purine NTP pyrophosphatase [Hyphomicrobiales bacterium]|nr:RdgB/HAM1 family non-canonical purine NTP pyrophosphatase [Rhodobiaceae bacterium]HXK53650.1 RdgB/HAM1 family non-canonical purine NTP pyrophosphatase [Hyphomicrobiales bacterium]
MRRFDQDILVLATHNAGKVREIGDLVAPFGIGTLAAGDLSLAEPVEDGDSFAANAKIKALAIARASARPALADDSGLCVDALGGAPGIYSARWAGPAKDFALAMARVERELTAKGAVDEAARRAHFACALCLAWPDGHVEQFEGRVDGHLVFPPRGARGFGYDPIFVAEGEHETFGEMAPARKHAMSHRARAFARLVDGCFAARE